MKKILLLSIVLFSFLKSFSQSTRINNIVGENITIVSEVLGENREIQVFLPNGYTDSNQKYPVVYLLDGQRFFLYGTSLYQTFSEFKLTPDFIVVGVTNQQSTRMSTFSAGAEKFMEYLQKEVVNLIDNTYRTSNKRLLFGWAYGGGFAIKTLISTPNLFDGYILSSPFPVSSIIKKLDTFLDANESLNTFVYFASDEKEFGVKEGTEELYNLLNNKKTNLRWKFNVLSGEEHRSTVYPTLYHGIKEYFYYYRELSFVDLKEFEDKGGMTYVKSYYKIRSEKYNLKNEISPFAKYNMIRLAMRANNYEQFDTFLKEFNNTQLLSELRESLGCTIARFYAANNKKQKAIEYYKYILELYPNSKRAKEGLNTTIKLK